MEDTEFRIDADIMGDITRVLGAHDNDIHDVKLSTEGMTNQSFSFSIADQRYMFRIPGVGTEELIDRHVEKNIYEILDTPPHNLTDEVIWFDADSGRRITRFYDDARVADPFDDEDLNIAMSAERRLHDLGLVMAHRFDIRAMIDRYEAAAKKLHVVSQFADYADVRERAQRLLDLRDDLAIPEVLCHGDSLYANVLIFPDGSARLIDWEYAGMSDPIMDVAMFGIFSYFDKDRLDLSLSMWKGSKPTRAEYGRLYLYTALAGFLWSVWGAVMTVRGDDLADYTSTMYSYMVDYDAILNAQEFFVAQPEITA